MLSGILTQQGKNHSGEPKKNPGSETKNDKRPKKVVRGVREVFLSSDSGGGEGSMLVFGVVVCGASMIISISIHKDFVCNSAGITNIIYNKTAVHCINKRQMD